MEDVVLVDRPMRADARRSRHRLFDAARELILEIGGEPTRDAIAHRAGVGIGTLYRHFPDRMSAASRSHSRCSRPNHRCRPHCSRRPFHSW